MYKERKTIQDLWVIGVNYKNTNTQVRGQYAVSHAQYQVLAQKAPDYHVNDFFVLSTCNRTEIYGFAQDPTQLAGLLCSVSSGDMDTFNRHAYYLSGDEAMTHLFRVGAGLESQILGDFEIQGQLKLAVKHAREMGCISSFMERLMNSVFQASKAVKTKTAISGGTVSVAFAAVQCIRDHYHQHLHSKFTTDEVAAMPEHCRQMATNLRIVVVGTGKIGRTTCKNLVDYIGPHNVTLLNRTERKAVSLAAELGLKWAPIDTLGDHLAQADIILVSTSSPEPLIRRTHLEGHGPKLVVDISVPCNVHPDAQQLDNITFVNVDELSRIKDETLQMRQAEVPAAMRIIEDQIADFKEWNELRSRMPVLKEVRNKLKQLDNGGDAPGAPGMQDEKIQKVINTLAVKMRSRNTAGCNYIEALNEYFA